MNKIINPNEYGSLLFDKKEEDAVLNVLRNSNEKIFRYSSANESKVDEFEKLLREFVNVKYSLGVTNGTSGLITALIGCNIKPGDRVLVSSYTFLATALAVKAVGGVPVPMEIDMKYGIDFNDLEEQIKKGCKAIIVVHLQGRCYDLSKVSKIAKENNIYLIEDSCQGFASFNKNKYAGTFGDVGVYSFQQFKQITCGEGGAVVTNNKNLYNRMRNYVDMGAERELFPNWNGKEVLFGQNYRMNNIQGAILVEQMKKLEKMLKNQKESRDYIMSKVTSKKIINSSYPEGDTHMNILVLFDKEEDFNKLKNIEKETNIEIRRMWSGLYFENNLFKNNKLTSKDLKGKECSKTKNIITRLGVISIPPTLTKDDCNKIIDYINKYC